MITKEMVGHIKDTLNDLTRGKNTNFGKNENAASAPEKGILVVLTSSDFLGESFTASNQILASSTVIGTAEDVFKNEGTNKTIDVISIPYSETISVVDNGEAKGFAIVEVNQDDLESKKITGSDANAELWSKYVIKVGSDANVSNYKVLFSGDLSTPQIIQKDNSFSLSNIKITFN